MIPVFNEIADKVSKASIPPRILLSKFRFIDETSKYSRECLDPSYLPFYYYLGTKCPCKNLLEIGFGIGLNAACYLMGSPKTENYLTIQEPQDTYYSTRMGVANIKQVWRQPFYAHVGHLHDEVFVSKMREHKWDVVIINEKKDYDTHLLWLNTIWDEVRDGGLIFIDNTTLHHQTKRAYDDFCIIKNRNKYVFDTRYGVGVLIR